MYLWLKAVHIIAVIAWMAGMLYLPRLFVYHVGAPKGSAMSETFKVMERRLLRAIINPAMIVVFITGPLLAYVTGFWQDPWLQIKFVLALGLGAAARLFRPCGQSLREGRKYAPGELFPAAERGPDRADDPDRAAGRHEALLNRLIRAHSRSSIGR